MGLLPYQKHKLDGIGSAGAVSLMAALALNPTTSGLTIGVAGRVLSFVLTKFFSFIASFGLVTVNVGAEKLITALDKHEYDGSFESAEKLIDAIRATGRDLTPEEIKAIDDEVKKAFRKFARIGKKKKD